MKMIEVVMWIFPWLTPIPTAWLIGRATSVHLQWPTPIAFVAALIVEGFGFSAIATALMLREYNVTRRKTDPAAPFWIALILVAVYFAAAVGLTVLMDIIPGLSRFAPAVFPVFSLSGMTIAALHYDHRQRVANIKAEKAEARAERLAKASAVSEPKPALVSLRCKICGHTANTQNALNAHMRIHTNGNGHKEAEQVTVV